MSSILFVIRFRSVVNLAKLLLFRSWWVLIYLLNHFLKGCKILSKSSHFLILSEVNNGRSRRLGKNDKFPYKKILRLLHFFADLYPPPPPGSKHFFCTLKILKIESTSYIRSNCGMGKTLYYCFSHLLSPATTDCFRSIVEHFIN